LEKLLVGVTSKEEIRATNQERMRELAEVNYEGWE
jgi:hypothetical protein